MELINGHWCRNFIDSFHSWILKGTNYKWPFIILCFLLFKTLFFNFNIFCSHSSPLQCPFRSFPPPYPLDTKLSFKKQRKTLHKSKPKKTIPQRIKKQQNKNKKNTNKSSHYMTIICWSTTPEQEHSLDCLILQNLFSLF